MPLRDNGRYHLVLFDRAGNERPEPDGSLLSQRLATAAADGVTDVFLASHGWMGDVPAAISQYDAWTAAMSGQEADLARARARDPGFKPLVVAVHWPSRPWGTETTASGLLSGPGDEDEFAAEQQLSTDSLVERYAERIADTPAARAALTTILAASGQPPAAAHASLPPALEQAYQTLFAEAGLGLEGAAAPPGCDQQAFAPAVTISTWTAQAAGDTPPAGPAPGLLGGAGRRARDAWLMPVRQLSFWCMKNRARLVGESGVHALLARLQDSAPRARFHLMGHSFGCIVVCAAIGGPLGGGAVTSRLPRPVRSLLLVQGALSLWSFAGAIPYPPRAPGYFRPLEVSPGLVAGPIVTTRSSFDRAVGTFYPLAARVRRQLLLDDELPEYGGAGAFGLQGTPAATTHDLRVLNADASYGFAAGHLYNVEASRIIRRGGGPSGAHSDIAHPEIAHLFWQAMLPSMASSG
jgi:hypothetical protein